jgi:nicotinamidase-related amidase
MEKTALILVDIQNDYFPNGRMELYEPHKAASNARRILDFFRSKNLPLFHIQHIFLRPDAPFFAPGTEGAKIHESVAPHPEETVIQKHYPNSFRDTPLLDFLHKADIENVVICGMMSHMCIDATVRAAVDYGFNCTVIEDACTCPSLSTRGRTIPAIDVHDAFMAALGSSYATLETTNSFLENAEN